MSNQAKTITSDYQLRNSNRPNKPVNTDLKKVGVADDTASPASTPASGSPESNIADTSPTLTPLQKDAPTTSVSTVSYTPASGSPVSTSPNPSPTSMTTQQADPPISVQLNNFMGEMRGLITSMKNDLYDEFDHVLREMSKFKSEIVSVKSTITDMGVSLTDTSDRVKS